MHGYAIMHGNTYDLIISYAGYIASLIIDYLTYTQMAMGDGSSPVERLVAHLSRSSGNLKDLRNKLGLPLGVDTNLVLTPLCWYVYVHSRRQCGLECYILPDRSNYIQPGTCTGSKERVHGRAHLR